jgi:predicted O-linked N-acetylglucosamine transferase (SPINDLY family)
MDQLVQEKRIARITMCQSLERMPNEMKIAISLFKNDQYDLAQKQCTHILSRNPNHPDALHLLGLIVAKTGRIDKAIQLIQKAIQIFDLYSVYHSNLAVFLAKIGDFEKSIAHYQKALKIKPDDPGVLNNMGMALFYQKKLEQSRACYIQALEIKPDYYEANVHLSMVYESLYKMDDAIACCQKVISQTDDCGHLAMAFNQLGNVYLKRSQIDAAISSYKNALKNKTDSHQIWSNYLLTLNYDFKQTNEKIFQAHKKWGQHISQTVSEQVFHANMPDISRPIRVGYLSPDLRMHPVAFFVEPLLKFHQNIDVYCYADVQKPDNVTHRLSTYQNTWKNISGYSNTAVMDQIRADGIDILVDLTGHTAKNRLQIFAAKPAPIQISYLGYTNTTGLQTMDYLFTDACLDPVKSNVLYTEKLIRINPCFCCYLPPDISIDVSELPALTNKYITFGAFHNLIKVSEQILSLWADILKSIPNSHLIIQSITLSDSSCIRRYRQWFEYRGISSDRIEYLGYQPFHLYLQKHHEIDIMLDTQPWSGHTVACHGLWMGIPIITIDGRCHAGRMVASILKTLGVKEWIASTPDHYIEKAMYWSNSLSRLAELRKELRTRMCHSFVCDGSAFTQKVEQIYIEVWRKWCHGE